MGSSQINKQGWVIWWLNTVSSTFQKFKIALNPTCRVFKLFKLWHHGVFQSRVTVYYQRHCTSHATTLTPAQIAGLLNFVLRSTHFQYNGSTYEQLEGAAMESQVSVVTCIANLYMESFEQQAITTWTSSSKLRIWKRYVDNTLTILDCGNIDSFLQHLNNQQPSIRFIMETVNNYKLTFLDNPVSREPDRCSNTGVYRKPTHTDQYLEYDSYHLQSAKCRSQVPLRARQMSHNKILCHLQGEKAPVLCSCL